jgi:hypothetical protein
MNCKLDSSLFEELSYTLKFQVDFYTKVFDYKTNKVFTARIFGTEKEYKNYSREHLDFNPVSHNALAFYNRESNEMLLHLETTDLLGTFKHELSHGILDHYCELTPYWLNEGMAQLMSTIGLSEDKSSFTFSSNFKEYFVQAKKYILQNPGIDVSSTIYAKNMSTNAYEKYLKSWMIVTYLYITNQKMLISIIGEICSKQYELLDYIYPGGISVLNADMKFFFMNYKSF